MQDLGDPSQPGVSLLDILSLSSVFLQSPMHLLSQTKQIADFFRLFCTPRQCCSNCFQLLITCQATPVKRLAAIAIHSIPDRLANLCLDLSQLVVSGRSGHPERGVFFLFLCF